MSADPANGGIEVRVRKVSRNGNSSFEPLTTLREEEESGNHCHAAGKHAACLQHVKHETHDVHKVSANNKSASPSHDGEEDVPLISKYVLALRPWSFSASLTPVMLGAVLAYKCTLVQRDSGLFDPLILIVTLCTVVAVHAAGNIANTYYDYVKHVDRKAQSEDRTLVDHRLTVDELTGLGVLSYSVGCFGMVCLCFLSSARIEHLALVFFGGLSASFAYTGGIGFKYIGLGDVVILIIFGPTSLLFSYMAQTGGLNVGAALYAIPLAMNTEAIFHCNNTRNMESDRSAGAVTLAILIGSQMSHVLYALLLFVPYIVFIFMGLHCSFFFLIPLVTIPQAFRLEKEFRSQDLSQLPRRTARLNLYFGIFYLMACCLTEASNLPLLTTSLSSF